MNKVFFGEPPSNIKQWIINKRKPNDKTVYKVQTTSSYKKTGIYSAQQDDANKPVTIDWGDGNVEEVAGDINQKTHTYSSVGEFTVEVSNIKTFAANANNGQWNSAISQNYYTLKEVVKLNKSIMSIGDWAFYYCPSLTSVTIGTGVTSIGYSAFRYCPSLTSVTIPEGVTSIGYSAFNDCHGLTSVTIPNSVTSISEDAFSWCSSLTSVTIPDGVTSIGYSAFRYCPSLTSVTIGGGVKSIGNWAFGHCSSLVNMTIPDSVKSIGDWAFGCCDSLTEYYMLNIDSSIVAYNAKIWGIGFDSNFKKFLAIVYCKDGVVVVNDSNGSSGS